MDEDSAPAEAGDAKRRDRPASGRISLGPTSRGPESRGPESRGVAARYWRANVRLLGMLLGVWFAVSLGAGILLVDVLNAIEIGGFKLGFWFAQQGSILAFVALIFVYAHRMRRIERELGVDEDSKSRKEAAL